MMSEYEGELTDPSELPKSDHEYSSDQIIEGMEDRQIAQFFKLVSMLGGVAVGVKAGHSFEAGNTFDGVLYSVLGTAMAYISTRLAKEEQKASGQQGSDTVE